MTPRTKKSSGSKRAKVGATKALKKAGKKQVTTRVKTRKRSAKTRARAVGSGRAVGGGSAFVGAGRSGNGVGLAVMVAVAESVGGEWDVAQAKVERVAPRKGGGGAVAAMTRAARGIATKQRIKKLAGTLAALGHPARVAMLVKLLEGPATYQALQKESGLKAGPLYHHINQLRLASLILPKQRDLYALTRGGRNVLVGGLALMSLASDKRERPVVGG